MLPRAHRLPRVLAHNARPPPYLVLLHSVSQLRQCRRNSTFNSHYNPSDFSSSGTGFSSVINTREVVKGPLGSAGSSHGGIKLTPRALKMHLDRFVVGQILAKRILSTAIYFHYKRIQQKLEREEIDERVEGLRPRVKRRDDTRMEQESGDMSEGQGGERHAVEEEYPGQQQTSPPPTSTRDRDVLGPGTSLRADDSPLTIEKSNILCLGPTGVGKTLMLRTLARVLDVPFSMSDCTPFTQAGYVGEDADICIHRLLVAANWNVKSAESGIVCLDEFDKLAKPKNPNAGKDISGESVQQSLLKLLEGTTLQIKSKPERKPPAGLPGNDGSPSSSSASAGHGSSSTSPSGQLETFNIDTSNILFICTGAFVGLDKIINERVAKGSLGFNAHVRGKSVDDLAQDSTIMSNTSFSERGTKNVLELAEPTDLIEFGLIPEITGRIPVIAAVEKLDIDSLVRILTEPRNALLKQYEQLFELCDVELKFTPSSLTEIAKAAMKMGTGARGLRSVVESLMQDAMFEVPGSSTRYVLVTENVAKRKCAPLYFSRGQQEQFRALAQQEGAEGFMPSLKDAAPVDLGTPQAAVGAGYA